MGQIIYVVQIVSDPLKMFEPGARFPQPDFLSALRNGDIPLGTRISRRADPSEFTVIPSKHFDKFSLVSDNGVVYCVRKNQRNAGGLQLMRDSTYKV